MINLLSLTDDQGSLLVHIRQGKGLIYIRHLLVVHAYAALLHQASRLGAGRGQLRLHQQGKDVLSVDVLALMVEKRESFEDFSTREEEYLPRYAFAI